MEPHEKTGKREKELGLKSRSASDASLFLRQEFVTEQPPINNQMRERSLSFSIDEQTRRLESIVCED